VNIYAYDGNIIFFSKILEQKCRLIELSATHPDPKSIQKTLEALEVEMKIERADLISIVAKIETPLGIFEL